MTETTVTVTTTEGTPSHNATSQPTVKSDPGQSQNSLAWIRLNVAYFRTIPGILKVLQVVSCLQTSTERMEVVNCSETSQSMAMFAHAR
jgi:hypothetical protein